jgi:hypothetical protein
MMCHGIAVARLSGEVTADEYERKDAAANLVSRRLASGSQRRCVLPRTLISIDC